MKKVLKNNKKGFTLIELLAVIVILAILVMVAIPAVTKYLNSARQGTFADNAKSAIGAVRNDVIMNGKTNVLYTLNGTALTSYSGTPEKINDLLEKKLTTSPWGKKYDESSYIYVETKADGDTTYYMCLVDSDGHGWTTKVEEKNIGCDAKEDTNCVNAAITVDTNKNKCIWSAT